MDRFNHKYFLIWINSVFGVLFLFLSGFSLMMYGLMAVNLVYLGVSCVSFTPKTKPVNSDVPVESMGLTEEQLKSRQLFVRAQNNENRVQTIEEQVFSNPQCDDEIKWLLSSAD